MTLRGEGAQYVRPPSYPRVIVARLGIPDANAAMDRLFELFPDKYPVLVTENDQDWTFELSWPRHLLEHVDPLLSDRSRNCFGLDLSELDGYTETQWCHEIPILFSMFHSLALLAPALASTTQFSLPSVIVHVDAHHDLSPGLLGKATEGSLISELFKMRCRLDSPDTISRSIQAGIINKANFLTAYLLATTPGMLIHVETGCRLSRFSLAPVTQKITLGSLDINQNGFNFDSVLTDGNWSLLECDTMPFSLEGESKVWLDVDLDALCNRFDGDSDNRNKCGSQLERDHVLKRAKCLLENLSRVDWLRRISAVSIAASPAFFPSEHWDPIVPLVRDGIVELLTR